MPRQDGTGPRGRGPMSGRAAGFCAGYDTPGYANRGGERRWRNRSVASGGRGWGGIMPLDATPDQEAAELKQQEQALSQTLESIRRRLQQFERRDSEKT